MLFWPLAYDPGGQREHAARPVVAENWPGPQPLQFAWDVANATDEAKPAGQYSHPIIVLPATSLKRPRGQLTQVASEAAP